jgi:GntR family transcriptional regulator / MocR family aminotransferase
MAIPDTHRASPGPETARIFAHLRDRILSGSLLAGDQLGPAPQIAREMDAAGAVVRKALDQLIAEGYLIPGPRSSLRVAAGATLETSPEQDFSSAPPGKFVPFRFDLIDFRPGVPDLSRFPSGLWQRISGEVWRQMTPLDLSYSQPEGRAELRREIARHLSACRGVRCQPEQIVVTSGSTQALNIAARVLLRRTRPDCIMEDPGSADSSRILAGMGGRIIPVPADEHGLVTDQLPQRARPCLIHVTPSHQFPLGGTMPVQRRVRLLSYARKHSAFVVEEDYDGDFRYDSPPVSSIQGLLPSRVIYVGTFSMTLFPSLRVGFIVVPPALIEEARIAKRSADFHTAALEQLVLARLMKDGYYARHLVSMEKNYRKSRALLLDALHRHFGDEARILGAASGLHVCVRFPGIRFTPTLLNRIDLAGVGVYPVEDHTVRKGLWEDTVILGFGMLDDRRINTGMAILKRCLPAL